MISIINDFGKALREILNYHFLALLKILVPQNDGLL